MFVINEADQILMLIIFLVLGFNIDTTFEIEYNFTFFSCCITMYRREILSLCLLEAFHNNIYVKILLERSANLKNLLR
uniref:Uncharacterized protein n=1 Tax=Cannabis sativa TaxID=3483 RepID=A0A803QYQ3_CANSA